MYENSSARQILMLAAEDAFEFERWRDAGPVTADIDPEVKAAEIAEFEALGVPMPAELDSLKRELEHAPKVREAIRASALAMRRSGRASASALVALGPQQLMPAGPGGMPWAGGWPMGMDPRMDPRIAARMAEAAGYAVDPRATRRGRPRRVAGAEPGYADEPPRAEPGRGRGRRVGSAAVIVDDEPVEAEVVDDHDDLDGDFDAFEDERPRRTRSREARSRESRSRDFEPRGGKRRGDPRRARAARPRDEWDEDEDFGDDDDSFDSMIAVRPAGANQKVTWMLGGLSAAAVIALLWIGFGKRGEQPELAATEAGAQQQQAQQPAPAAPVQPAAPVEPAIDPATGLPIGQAPLPGQPQPAAAPAGGGGRGGRSSGVTKSRAGSSSGGGSKADSGSSGGGLNPFADYKTPDDPAGMGSKPAAGGGAAQPAAGDQAQPAAGDSGAQPGAGDGGTQPGGEQAQPVGGGASQPPAGDQAQPGEQTKPAEPPKPEEPKLTKSKMTPAIRSAVVGKVGELQACYQDAVVGKPDLAGKVVFTISLDQDGVVKKVEIGKDEVKYGVAKCAAKKIRRWTLPSAGIPIIFDLPFDFRQ